MAGKIKYGTYEEATGGKYPKPGWHTYNGVKYMDWTIIDTERGISAKDYDTIMIASHETNQWGSPRSYEIVFDHTIPSQVFPSDHPVAAAVAWQYSNVAITRQKDSERYCSFPSNYQIGTAFPSFDLREFQQEGDNVVNDDLVFW
jgi:Cu2+-containing amine oxidase